MQRARDGSLGVFECCLLHRRCIAGYYCLLSRRRILSLLELLRLRMENIQPVGYGPVKIVWSRSRIADHRVVVENLQSKLRCKVVGLSVSEMDGSGYYIYGMVVWPEEMTEDTFELEDSTEEEVQQWRHGLQSAVTELERLSLEELPPASIDGSQWCIESCGEGERPSQVITLLLDMVEIQRAILEHENKVVLFGRDALEEVSVESTRRCDTAKEVCFSEARRRDANYYYREDSAKLQSQRGDLIRCRSSRRQEILTEEERAIASPERNTTKANASATRKI